MQDLVRRIWSRGVASRATRWNWRSTRSGWTWSLRCWSDSWPRGDRAGNRALPADILGRHGFTPGGHLLRYPARDLADLSEPVLPNGFTAYDNGGFVVLALITERASGTAFHESRAGGRDPAAQRCAGGVEVLRIGLLVEGIAGPAGGLRRGGVVSWRTRPRDRPHHDVPA